MKSLNGNFEEEDIFKDIRNLFRLKKELNYTTVKDSFSDEKKKIKQLKLQY